MTDREPRKDEMRNITLMEYERNDKSGQTRGWWVRIKRGNEKFSRLFSYNKYGGKENALVEAKRFRDKIEGEFGVVKDLGFQTSKTSRNKSGIIGIHREPKITRRPSGKVYIYENWIASWIDPVTKKRKMKPFAISKYGEAGALMLAIKARDEAIGAIAKSKEAPPISPESPEDTFLPHLVQIVETAQTANEKGSSLEALAISLFRSIPGFEINFHDIKTETEEIDIVILNGSNDPRFKNESTYLLVECKNWTGKCGKDEFVLFRQKIENRGNRSKLGFLVSWNGFTETISKEMLRGSRGDPQVVLLSGQDIKKAVETGDFFKILTTAFDKTFF
ncbi:MAG: hypothetical protein JETCAE01_32040 [Anaerolineaceae bacterium]|nr:MAG: hypothetical protein JETCAE01_32040 [Anaerolineaceae bacterium]